MQPFTGIGDARAILTADNLTITPGLYLLDQNDVFVEDISADLESGTIEHGNYRDIHGTCRLRIARKLDWGRHRVRPYMIASRITTTPASSSVVTAGSGSTFPLTFPVTFGEGAGGTTTISTPGTSTQESVLADLGVYLLSTPTSRIGEDPQTYEVEGYDKTLLLRRPMGVSFQAVAGGGVLAAVAQVLGLAGIPSSQIQLSGRGDDVLLPSDRLWVVSEENTYRKVIGELLSLGGFAGIWCDWQGSFRTGPYQSPSTRSPEWVYDADDVATTIVGMEWSETVDLFDTPNEFVGVRNDPTQAAPTTGAGIYTRTNQSTGPASVDARGGVVWREVVAVDAATHASLVAQVDRRYDDALSIATHLDVTTGPNPLHWHFDVISLKSQGITRKFVSQEWTIDLAGADMTHRWRLLP